jgi:hypothetical protein
METAERSATKAFPVDQGLHPKCANPTCPVAFDWFGGGRFFRFKSDSAANHHGVHHYWLCENCSRAFTLSTQGQEIVLKPVASAMPDTAPSLGATAKSRRRMK